MEITDIQVYPLGYLREYPSAFYRSFALVKVQTDAGIIGWGEASDCFGHANPFVILQIIEEEFKRHLLGEDPLMIERHMKFLHGWLYRSMGLEGAVVQALSGVEIALWDIRGKVREEPIHQMLGSYRDQIAIYGAGTIAFDQPPDWHVGFFEHLLERGCNTIKLRSGRSLRWDLELVKGVREIVGDEIDIIVDGKFNYTLPSAIKLAQRFEDLDVLYFEEPMPEYNLEAMATLVASTSTPIAYGEHTYTVRGFRNLIAHNAVNVIQPDATLTGGLIEAHKASILADAWGLPVSPHCGGLTAVGIAANVHLSAASPTFTVLEYDATPGQPLREELVMDGKFSPDRIVEGCLSVPEGPGLGIEINEQIIEQYAYQQRGKTKDLPGYGRPHL
jgi:L-alanine-DL-glutamate epimerase-like enolase superfamily enzyme